MSLIPSLGQTDHGHVTPSSVSIVGYGARVLRPFLFTERRHRLEPVLNVTLRSSFCKLQDL